MRLSSSACRTALSARCRSSLCPSAISRQVASESVSGSWALAPVRQRAAAQRRNILFIFSMFDVFIRFFSFKFLKKSFRGARKRPARCRRLSRHAKTSCTAQETFAACENALHSAGNFRGVRKCPAQRRRLSRRAKNALPRTADFRDARKLPFSGLPLSYCSSRFSSVFGNKTV